MPTVDIDKFKEMSRSVKKDSNSKYVTFGNAGELSLLPSHIPFGIPSGLPQLDWALGRNGYPAGRIIEHWGFEMCGKSAAGYAAMAEVQKLGGFGCWIETEHTFDIDRATRVGIDLDRMMIAEVDSIEGIFNTQSEILDQREKHGITEPFLFVIDSIGAVTSEMDIEKYEKEKWKIAQVGIDAKQTKGLLRVLNSKLARSQATTIFINHGVENAQAASPFAKKGKAGGGHAVKFYASLRAEFVKIGNIRDDSTKQRLGQTIKINIEKLKSTSLNRSDFEIPLIDGLFDKTESLYLAMLDSGVMNKPAGKQTITLLPGTPQERTFKKDEWLSLVEEMGGYDSVYKAWLSWAVAEGRMKLWGSM